jgi:hypothetical protein
MKTFYKKLKIKSVLVFFKYSNNEERLEKLNSALIARLFMNERSLFKYFPVGINNSELKYSLTFKSSSDEPFFPKKSIVGELSLIFEYIPQQNSIFELVIPDDFQFKKLNIQFLGDFKMKIITNIIRDVTLDKKYLGNVIFDPHFNLYYK